MLTITAMYNVLYKLRSGEPLTDKEKTIHEQGLVSVLKQLHDDLDSAVFDAYGWPHDLTDEEILAPPRGAEPERAADEARGIVRWLRPEFQAPRGDTRPRPRPPSPSRPREPEAQEVAARPAKKAPWPKSLPDQVHAVRSALSAHPSGLTPAQLARTFLRRTERVAELLDTLASLGQARASGTVDSFAPDPGCPHKSALSPLLKFGGANHFAQILKTVRKAQAFQVVGRAAPFIGLSRGDT